MNTLELFLANAGGENVEATHQRILAWLLGSRTVVHKLLDKDLKIEQPVTSIETHNKLFDIQIDDGKAKKGDTKTKALVEIKMWAALSQNQQDRQQNKAKEFGVPMFYFLFGISGLERNPDEKRTLKMKQVADSLRQLTISAELIASELTTNESKPSSEMVVTFLETYASRLDHLDKWLIGEAWKPVFHKKPTKTAHFASLFFKIKKIINDLYPKYNPLLYRSGKGDVNLDIRKKINDKEDENQETEIEGEEGTLVFWLKNKKLQIFFHSKIKAGIVNSKAVQIQHSYRAKWQGNDMGKLPSHQGTKVKWVCLLSIKYRPNKIEKEEEFGALAEFLVGYYKAFLEIKPHFSK